MFLDIHEEHNVAPATADEVRSEVLHYFKACSALQSASHKLSHRAVFDATCLLYDAYRDLLDLTIRFSAEDSRLFSVWRQCYQDIKNAGTADEKKALLARAEHAILKKDALPGVEFVEALAIRNTLLIQLHQLFTASATPQQSELEKRRTSR